MYERGFVYLILTQSSFSHFSLFPLPISTLFNPVPTPTLPPALPPLPPRTPSLPYTYPFLTRTPPSPWTPFLTLSHTYPSLTLTPSSPCTLSFHIPQESPPLGPQCLSTHGESKRCSDSLYLKVFSVCRTDVSTANLICFVLCSLLSFLCSHICLLILFPFSSSFFCLLSTYLLATFSSYPFLSLFPFPTICSFLLFISLPPSFYLSLSPHFSSFIFVP